MLEKKISSSQAIRILLWSPKGAGLHYGGPGMSAYRMYNKADSNKLEISLVHGNIDQERYDIFKEQYKLTGSYKGIREQLFFLFSAQLWLKKNAHRFDIFHGLMSYHSTISPALLAQKMGLPALVRVAANQSDLADKQGWRSFFGLSRRRREMVKRLAGIIAISQAIVNELIQYGIPESKIVYIPNGVNTNQFYPPKNQNEKQRLRQKFGLLDLPTFLFSGGINQRKRPHIMVEAIGILHKKGLDTQLVLAGPEDDPALVAQMKQRCKELNIESKVVWYGFTKDIASIYRVTDIFGLLSSCEGMPNALLEAMASGLPSIVTNISGCSELINDGVNGFIVEANAEKVAERLSEYVKDTKLRNNHGHVARKNIMNKYSISSTLATYEKLFKRILSGGPVAEQSLGK